MKVFVLDFNGVANGYVVDPKNLSVYQTEKLKYSFINMKSIIYKIIFLLDLTALVLLSRISFNSLLNFSNIKTPLILFCSTLFSIMVGKYADPYYAIKIKKDLLQPVNIKDNYLLLKHMLKNRLEESKTSNLISIILYLIVFILIILEFIITKGKNSSFIYLLIALVSNSYYKKHHKRTRIFKKLLSKIEQYQ